MTNALTDRSAVFTPEFLLAHFEGHRRVTRRTIEVFPDDQLFTFTPAPPLRPFAAMMLEVIGMIEPTVRGLESGEWTFELPEFKNVQDKAALLRAWDEADALLRDAWARLTPQAIQGVVPPLPHLNALLYLIDNEVHHRAQGFVYLRLLGVEPPAFYER